MRKRFTWGGIICLGMYICLFLVPVYKAQAVSAKISDFRIPKTFSFTRDLHVGTTTSPDVAYLQNILNMSTSTRVAETGAGSNKQLSSFYGPKTADAMRRFQTLFALDIDYERAISTSTATSTTIIASSTVDEFTRAVLNKLVIIYSNERDQYYEYTNTGTTTYKFQNQPTTASQTTTSGNGNNSSGSNGGNSSSDSSGIQMPHEVIYQGEKMLFTYSPQGQLLKAIGGEKLANQVFSYTPAGLIGGMGSGGAAGGAGAAGGLGAGFGGAAGSSASGLLAFGGKSTSMTTCTCSYNYLIYVYDPRGYTLPLIYQPGVTVLYANWRPTSGVNMLGKYITGGQCLIYAGTTCTSGGTPVGTMAEVGTSLSL